MSHIFILFSLMRYKPYHREKPLALLSLSLYTHRHREKPSSSLSLSLYTHCHRKNTSPLFSQGVYTIYHRHNRQQEHRNITRGHTPHRLCAPKRATQSLITLLRASISAYPPLPLIRFAPKKYPGALRRGIS